MKTYALYLLILCFSVLGCQKDIGEDETELAKKKEKNCKCKVLYIPILDAPNYDTVVVKLNDGGKKYILDQYIIKIYNKYNQLTRWETWDLGNNRISEVWDFYYKDGLINSYNFIQYLYPSDGGIEIDRVDYKVVRDKNKLKHIYRRFTTTRGNPANTTREDTVSLSYYPDNSIESYSIYKGSYVALRETFINNDKNYFAKDIEESELPFLTNVDMGYGYLPTHKDISSSAYYNNQTDQPWTRYTTYTDKEYNEAGYPVFYKEVVETYDQYGHYTYTSEKRITYRKVVVKN